jgi:hypothetical protein
VRRKPIRLVELRPCQKRLTITWLAKKMTSSAYKAKNASSDSDCGPEHSIRHV